MSEVLVRGSEAKTSVSEYFAAKGVLPPTSTATTAPFSTGPAGKVGSAKWTEGAAGTAKITLTVANTASVDPVVRNKTIDFVVSSIQNGVLVWTCKTGATDGIAAKYLPGSCK